METNSLASKSMVSNEEIRKLGFRKGGNDIIKSPYNKVNIKDIPFNPKPKRNRIKGFPSEK